MPSIATGYIEQGRRHAGDLRVCADVVVVGSGAGGAVLAALCAEAGKRVIVLEEGPHVPVAEIQQMRPSQHLRRAWRDAAMSVAVGVGDSPSINVTMGRAVGGSSIVTGGVCFRTPDNVLANWSEKLRLRDFNPRDLDPYFAEVEEAIHVETVPESMRSESTRRFVEGARKIGLEMEPLRRNTKGCNGCGRCNFGCPHGAKMSVDMTYLPRALAKGAVIWSDCLVDSVIVENGRAAGVKGHFIGRKPGFGALFRPGRVEVRAPIVIMAAGAMHSPLLLAASGVGKRSGLVGKGMTLHPAFRMFARFDEPIEGWKGALQSAYTRSLEHQGITLMGLFVPAGVLAATMTGFGPEHVRRAKSIPNLAVFGGMIHDEGGGVVRKGVGREPIVTYRMAREDRARIPTMIRTMADAFFAAGAREVFPPILGQPGVTADELSRLDLANIPAMRLECSSQHPLGTARMGVDPDHSVVDPDGQSWEVNGLYVVDGSIVPTSLGVNPQLTVMTLATRIGRRLLERDSAVRSRGTV